MCEYPRCDEGPASDLGLCGRHTAQAVAVLHHGLTVCIPCSGCGEQAGTVHQALCGDCQTARGKVYKQTHFRYMRSGGPARPTRCLQCQAPVKRQNKSGLCPPCSSVEHYQIRTVAA